MFVRFSWMPQAAKCPQPSKFSTFHVLSKICRLHMGFNYGLEKKNFDRQWAIMRKQYEDAGMSIEVIQAMYEYDWSVFNLTSLMQALGVDIQTIQSIVGHADTEMTEHYLHVQESIRQSAIQLFSEAF